MLPFSEATAESSGLSPKPDLVCLSHLRWDFVYQRPQHLMSRFARDRRVFFFEEPMYGEGSARLDVGERPGGVRVAVPRLPEGLSFAAAEAAQRDLLRGCWRSTPAPATSSGTTRPWPWGSPWAFSRPPWSTTAWTSCRSSAALLPS